MYTVYTASGGEVSEPGIIAYEMERAGRLYVTGTDFSSLSTADQDVVTVQARLAYISTLYVENANQERYGYLKTQLDNDYTMGTSNFPATLQEAKNW